MTNIRKLKKDINFLCSEFVADCYIMLHLHPEKASEIETAADKVIDSRNELIYVVHHPENKSKTNFNKDRAGVKERNKLHKSLISDSFLSFLKLIDTSYEDLQKLKG